MPDLTTDQNSRLLNNTLHQDNFLMVNVPLMHQVGLKAAVFLEFLIFRRQKFSDNEGWVPLGVDQVENYTTLTRHEQASCIDKLRATGLIKVQIRVDEGRQNLRVIQLNADQVVGLLSGQKSTQKIIQKIEWVKGVNRKSGDGGSTENRVTVTRKSARIKKADKEVVVCGSAKTKVGSNKPTRAVQVRDGSDPHNRPRPKDDKPYDIPTTNLPVFTCWIDEGGTHHRSAKSKQAGNQAISAVRSGKFFRNRPGYKDEHRPFTDAQMMKAIRRFVLMRNDPTYHPVKKKDLKDLSLELFFYNPHWQGNGKGELGHSMFLQCLTQEPKKLNQQDPVLVDYTQKMARQHAGLKLGKEDAEGVTRRVTKYFREHQGWCKRKGIVTPKLAIEFWVRATDAGSGAEVPVSYLLAGFAERNFRDYMKDRNAH